MSGPTPAHPGPRRPRLEPPRHRRQRRQHLGAGEPLGGLGQPRDRRGRRVPGRAARSSTSGRGSSVHRMGTRVTVFPRAIWPCCRGIGPRRRRGARGHQRHHVPHAAVAAQAAGGDDPPRPPRAVHRASSRAPASCCSGCSSAGRCACSTAARRSSRSRTPRATTWCARASRARTSPSSTSGVEPGEFGRGERSRRAAADLRRPPEGLQAHGAHARRARGDPGRRARRGGRGRSPRRTSRPRSSAAGWATACTCTATWTGERKAELYGRAWVQRDRLGLRGLVADRDGGRPVRHARAPRWRWAGCPSRSSTARRACWRDDPS